MGFIASHDRFTMAGPEAFIAVLKQYPVVAMTLAALLAFALIYVLAYFSEGSGGKRESCVENRPRESQLKQRPVRAAREALARATTEAAKKCSYHVIGRPMSACTAQVRAGRVALCWAPAHPLKRRPNEGSSSQCLGCRPH